MQYDPTIEFGGLVWAHNPDGEYGEYSTEYKGHRLTVSTNQNSTEWDYVIDEGGISRAEIDSVYGAMREAMQETDYM